MSASSGRSETCEVCNRGKAKYSCPKCEVRTCCVTCVNIHKKELNCNGIRNRIFYKPLSKFTNFDLQSDYMLLEGMSRSVEKYADDTCKQYTRHNKELPVHLFKLRSAAAKRGIKLLFLPKNFSRHTKNSTFLNWKTQLITWSIEWVFPQAENLKCFDERLDERERLSVLISKYLEPNKCPELINDRLQFYQSAGLEGVTLLLKAENVRRASSRFYQLDATYSLKENLKGKILIEFPTIFVVFNDHKHIFEVVDSDEEEEEEETIEEKLHHNDSVTRNAMRHGKHKFKSFKKVKKNTNLLFTNSDFSDTSDGSDSCEKHPEHPQPVPNGSALRVHQPSSPYFVNEGASTSDSFNTNIGFDIPPYNILIRQKH